ncbi:CAP domain-containing protein [Pyronema omphalodes]|nr:CAP domain-containing protein [Pyronema omphalodes]
MHFISFLTLFTTAIVGTAQANLSPHDPRFAQEFVAAHNKYRAEHGSPPITWSPALANEAQAWVNQCKDEHDDRLVHGHGECLASGTAGFVNGPAHVIERFVNERDYYDYQTGESLIPDKPVGHFAEVVWEGNREVGCGVRYDCKNDFPVQYVCRYAPGGNILDPAQYRKNVKPRGGRY